jgi:hypothetical protein
MSDRQRRARETLIGGHWPNARRTDSERNLQAQSGVGDERSREFGKSARYRLRFHAATLLEFDWLCKRVDRKAEGLFRFAPDYVLVITTIDQGVDFAGGSVAKQNSAFDTFAEENL